MDRVEFSMNRVEVKNILGSTLNCLKFSKGSSQALTRTGFQHCVQKWFHTPFRYYQIGKFPQMWDLQQNFSIHKKLKKCYFMDIWPKRGELNSPKILMKNATREDEIFCTLRAKKKSNFSRI